MADTATIAAINSLSTKFETNFQQLSDKYRALSDSAGATGATLESNTIQSQAAIAQSEEVTASAAKTKSLAIGALIIVALIGLIFFLKK